MLTLLQFNYPVLLAALLIGIATGAWIVRGLRPPSEEPRPSQKPSPSEDRTT